MVSVGVMSFSRLLQMLGPATEKARVPTVDNLTGGMWRRFVPAERRARRPGRSATRVSGPRYRGASPCKTLYKPWPLFYTRCVSGYETIVMRPERRKYGRNAVLLSLALALGFELSLRTHLKSLALALALASKVESLALALALKVESLLASILNIFY